MKTIFISSLAVLICAVSFGQKSGKAFQSYAEIGLLAGKNGGSFHFNTDHGLRFSNFFLGAGAGYDDYKYRSVPLYASGRTFFGNARNVFFFGKIGYNIPLSQKPSGNIYYEDYYYKGGLYSGAGLGYRTRISKKLLFNMSGGFSYKETELRAVYTSPCFVPPCPETTDKYKFSFGRLLLAAGLEF